MIKQQNYQQARLIENHPDASGRKPVAGFTLLETIFALTLFLLLIVGAATSYVEIQKAQYKSNLMRKVQEQAQNILETLTREYRFGTTDYSCYAEKLNPPCDEVTADANGHTNALAILDNTGTKRVIFRLHEKKPAPVLEILRQEYLNNEWINSTEFIDGFHEMLTPEIVIKNLNFYLSPIGSSPYQNYTDNQKQFQPKVTIALQIDAIGNETSPYRKAEVFLQTTISSRIYQ